jgi:hypothetical protein
VLDGNPLEDMSVLGSGGDRLPIIMKDGVFTNARSDVHYAMAMFNRMSNSLSKLTEKQYLAIERAAEFRSEFLNGGMFAMSVGSTNHARLQQNLSGELYAALRGSVCEAFGSDFRIKVSSRIYTYPDVSVVCGEPRVAGDANTTEPSIRFRITFWSIRIRSASSSTRIGRTISGPCATTNGRRKNSRSIPSRLHPSRTDLCSH